MYYRRLIYIDARDITMKSRLSNVIIGNVVAHVLSFLGEEIFIDSNCSVVIVIVIPA